MLMTLKNCIRLRLINKFLIMTNSSYKRADSIVFVKKISRKTKVATIGIVV
jgi:hypothetical protein